MKSMRSLRERIDRLDKRIVRLLNKRAKYADDIGKIKEKLGLDVYSPEREKQVIENIKRENPGPLTDEAVRRVYERVIDESRRLERESADERRTSIVARRPVMMNIVTALRLDRIDLRNRRHVTILVVGIVVFIILLILGSFFIPYHDARGKGIVLAIDRGVSASEVYSRLADDDLITNRIVFKIVSRISSVERKIKAGKYLFVGHFSDYDVMKLLATGKSNLLVKVTVPEGLTVRQMASIYREDLGIDSARFVEEALGDSLAPLLGVPSSNLEGYLFPESYDFYYGTPAHEVLERMVEEFDEFFNDTLKAEAARVGRPIQDLIKVASIVEAEARVDSERAIIASVYYNRLRKHMPLEADPTIEYALGEHKRIYYKDLHIKSPYNTYEKIGLPPTPICNPGRKSILAALFPARTEFLYFVATGNGGHRFSRTYEDHLRAVRAYRRIMMKR